MTLNNLVNKAESATKKWWKWFLGAAIVIAVAVGLWLLRRQCGKIAKLEAEKLMREEHIKDLIAEAEVEEHENMAEALRNEAQKLRDEVIVREEVIASEKRAYARARAAIDRAQTWQELEKQAKGK